MVTAAEVGWACVEEEGWTVGVLQEPGAQEDPEASVEAGEEETVEGSGAAAAWTGEASEGPAEEDPPWTGWEAEGAEAWAHQEERWI